MALTEVPIAIGFSGGVETKKDSKAVPTTQLIDLRDAVFTKGTTISKRTGYDALSTAVDGGGVHDPMIALGARGDEVVGFTGSEAYSYRQEAGTWSHIGGVASVSHTERALVATGTDQSMPDAATVGGLTVAAWEDSRGGIWWSVVELDGGRVLRAPEQLASPGNITPRVVAVSDRVLVFWQNAGGGVLWAAPVNPSDYLTAPNPVVVTSDASTSFLGFDAVRHDDSVGDFPALIAWTTAAGFVRVGYVDGSGVLGGSGLPADVTSADVSEGPIAVAWAATPGLLVHNRVVVAWKDGTDVHVRTRDVGLAGGIATAVAIDCDQSPLRLAVSLLPDGTAWVWAEESDAAGTVATKHAVVVNSWSVATVVGTQARIRGHGLVSRAFVDDGEAFVVLTHPATFFPYAAVVRTDGVCVGRLLVGSSDGLPERGAVANVEQDADDPRVWRWPGLARELVTAQTGAANFTETSIRTVRLDFDDANAYQRAPHGPDLVIAGSCPLRYDGSTMAELGFHTAPDDGMSASATGGGSDPVVLYMACYGETDAQGVIHLGPMSVGTLVQRPDGATTTVTLPTYRLTMKPRSFIAVFRSEGNDTDADQPTLYRVSSLDPSATGVNGYVLNDPTVDEVTFTDALTDLDLLARERAYTFDGILSNDPVGLGAVVLAAKSRLFFTAPDNPHAVRYTKARRVGYGPEVSADLEQPVPAEGGDVTALAEMDGWIIAFKDADIFRFTGPGPLDNPDASPQVGFSETERVKSPVGCRRPRSIISTPLGIIFQADSGRHLLGRDFTVVYIGAPVERFNAQEDIRAVLLPERTQVLFLSAVLGDRALLYDYFHGQWSTWTNHEGTDGVVAGGAFYYARANPVDGRVFVENRAIYLDAGREIRLHIETAWIKLAGYVQGWQKLWYAHFAGAYLSPHTLRIWWAADYQPGWLEPYDLDVDADFGPSLFGAGPFGAGPFGGDSDSLYQKRIHVSLTGQAARVMIEDVASTEVLGASFELTELLLTGGMKRPAVQVGSARTS